ncbi:MAG: metal ABC transporter ATP-binding protein [Firmicutes bacterium]|nr:metal ABC transporter ATP-binding protein [Bacillota bacterium]
MALIDCRGVSLAYDGKTVVSGLDFQVNSGDYLCILGENGSGKSTLIKGLLRLKEPVCGSITYGDGLKKNEIGYLPQQTVIQRDFPATVYEVVLSGCLSSLGRRCFYGKKEKSAALSNMEKLGIGDIKNACYRELSGGQQQRVLLARALCATKKLLLLDEPVAGLDALVTGELYRLIEKLNRETGITVIIVSHDMSVAAKTATHILHLKHTQLFFGTREDYMKSAAKDILFGGFQA